MPLNNKFSSGWKKNRHARMVEMRKQANKVCEMIGQEIALEEKKNLAQREADAKIEDELCGKSVGVYDPECDPGMCYRPKK